MAAWSISGPTSVSFRTGSPTRSAFTRQYGAEPVFLTAREAAEAKTAGQTWTTPRCMTEREHGRYVQLTQAYAAH